MTSCRLGPSATVSCTTGATAGRARDQIMSIQQIKTTHVGSLPRPGDVTEAVSTRHSGGAISADAFEATIRPAVAAVLDRQVQAGIDIVNDGEFGKFSFTSYHTDRLDGLSPRRMPVRPPIAAEAADYPAFFRRWAYNSTGGTGEVAVCTGPVVYRNRGPVDTELRRLTDAAAEAGAAELFMTAISPGTL